MATQIDATHGNIPEREGSAKLAAGSSSAEAIAGVGAIILAVLGLARIAPQYMAPIATIAVGVAFWLRGGAEAIRFSTFSGSLQRTEEFRGMSNEFFAGAAGIILGILSLLGIAPAVLLSVAIIVYGAALLLGGNVMAQFASGSGQILVGLTAVILGILSLVGFNPIALMLVALLTLGFSLLFSGTNMGLRMLSWMR